MEDTKRKIIHNHPPTAASPKGASTAVQGASQQGIATLVVMLVVLSIIVMFCCFAAPGIRSLCRRFICRTCPFDDPDVDNIYTRNYGYRTDEFQVISEAPKKKHSLRDSKAAPPPESPPPRQ